MIAPASETHEGAAAQNRSGPLSLTVLGCDGSWPGPGGAGSAYLVSCGDTRLLVDAGPGTFARLQELIDPVTLDAVFISHHHPDHWSDLSALLTQARFAAGGHQVQVYAPADFRDRIGPSDARSVAWHLVTDGSTESIGDLVCTFHRTDHSFETLAVRIDGACRSLGYSADTGPGWGLDELGNDLDLVLCEATYTVDHEGTAGHMSGRQAGVQARNCGAARLVLTHRWPTIEASAVLGEAESTFGSTVEQAAIGKEFVL